MTCPSCKSPDVRDEQCEEDEYGPAYVAHVCKACGWRSDYPSPAVAHEGEGNCEGCRLPIRSGELVRRFIDEVVIHDECPTGAKA